MRTIVGLTLLLMAAAHAALPAANSSTITNTGASLLATGNTVLIEGLPAGRIGDRVLVPGGTANVVVGSNTVLIEGLPAATSGSSWAGEDAAGAAIGGVLVGGAQTVLIGP